MSGALEFERLTRLRARVLALTPRRAALLAFVLGALAVLGQPPFQLWIVTLLCFTGLVWLLDAADALPRRRRAMAFRAWMFGFGYFAAGIWWIANAFIARGPEFYALIPVAVTLAPAGLALFWAAAGWLCSLYWPTSPRRVAVFALGVFVAEYLRGHILTGFPWQQAGMVWSASGPVAQSVAWIGLYGLSLATLFAFAAPAALAGPVSAPARNWTRAAPMVAGFVLIAVLFAGGLGRLAGADPALTPLRLRLVQAAIPQDQKWVAENRAAIRDRYLELTAWPELDYVDAVVWPEAALPTFLLEDGGALAGLTDLLSGRAALATGLYRRDVDNGLLHNSLAVLDFTGGGAPRIAGLYDKVKLVPFGEFTPGGGLLAALGFRLPNEGEFASGGEPALLSTGVLPPFAPLICYEIIFPRFTPRGAARPQWLLNVSNDSWFGDTAGPRQHFAQARFRAIEEGLPVIRSASGGVSGAIDAWGRVRGQLPSHEPGVLDVALPVAAPPTIYSKFGDMASLLLLLALAGVAANLRAILPRTALTKPRA